MVAMNTMKVSVVDIVNVIAVLHGFATALFTVLMVVVLMNITGIIYRFFTLRV